MTKLSSGIISSSSIRTSTAPPSWTGPGEWPPHTNFTPSSETSPYEPSATWVAYRPSQNPYVGGASNVHGQPQSQLHAPTSSPRRNHGGTGAAPATPYSFV